MMQKLRNALPRVRPLTPTSHCASHWQRSNTQSVEAVQKSAKMTALKCETHLSAAQSPADPDWSNKENKEM